MALSILLGPAIACAGESTRPFRVTVVDRDSGLPVPGAEVRFRGEAHEGTLTGHGGRRAILFDVRSKTDTGGLATIPPTEFNARPFGWFATTHLDGPRLVISKEGYVSREIHNSQLFPSLSEYANWTADPPRIPIARGADPGGRNASQRIDESDEFLHAVATGQLPRGIRDPRAVAPVPTPAIKVNPPGLETDRKAATPAAGK